MSIDGYKRLKGYQMKVHEILSTQKNIFDRIRMKNIRPSIADYLELYEDYVRLKNDGHKMTYIVFHLSDVYGISERKIYYLVKKFEEEI